MNAKRDRDGNVVPQDWLRSTAVVVDGLVLTGPGLHFLYGSLEYFVPTADGNVLAVCIHVLFDEFLFDPVFVALFFVLTGLIEGRHLFKEILPHVRVQCFREEGGAAAAADVADADEYDELHVPTTVATRVLGGRHEPVGPLLCVYSPAVCFFQVSASGAVALGRR